jgi:hypothetical protein
MVRRVLSVLALLPLLLPPGLCVCHAPTAACTAGAHGDSRCPLAHLCLGHDAAGRHHDGRDSSGCPHRHAPGCPALQGVDHWAPRPGSVGQEATPALVGLMASGDTADGPCSAAPRSPRLGLPAGPVPLYLTLCTLLI